MSDAQGLSARELLTEVFSDLQNKLGGRPINLPSKAMAEIANDSDYHRTRIGYSCYESAVLVKSGDKEWAIAFGVKAGSYPAEPFNCDIAAVPVSVNGRTDDQLAEGVREALTRGYFHNSLIYAMADNHLGANLEGRFGQRIVGPVSARVKEFIAQDLETDPTCFLMDGRPVVRSPLLYKREFVSFLSEISQVVLAN